MRLEHLHSRRIYFGWILSDLQLFIPRSFSCLFPGLNEGLTATSFRQVDFFAVDYVDARRKTVG